MESIRQVLSVLIVFALLGVALWKLRRRGPAAVLRIPWNRTSKKARSLEQVEKLPLTPQHTLHLIRLHGREIVVATHPQGCTLISGEEKLKHVPPMFIKHCQAYAEDASACPECGSGA